MVVAHVQGLPAEHFAVAVASFGQRSQQAGVRKIERILGSDSQCASRVQKSVFWMTVAQLLEALLEIIHAGICRRCCCDPVGHVFPSWPCRTPFPVQDLCTESSAAMSAGDIGRQEQI